MSTDGPPSKRPRGLRRVDFHKADTNRDGKVTAAELDDYIRQLPNKIYIEYGDDRTGVHRYAINVTPEDTVQEVKVKLHVKCGVELQPEQFIYKGQTLLSHHTLKHYGVEQEGKLLLVLSDSHKFHGPLGVPKDVQDGGVDFMKAHYNMILSMLTKQQNDIHKFKAELKIALSDTHVVKIDTHQMAHLRTELAAQRMLAKKRWVIIMELKEKMEMYTARHAAEMEHERSSYASLIEEKSKLEKQCVVYEHEIKTVREKYKELRIQLDERREEIIAEVQAACKATYKIEIDKRVKVDDDVIIFEEDDRWKSEKAMIMETWRTEKEKMEADWAVEREQFEIRIDGYIKQLEAWRIRKIKWDATKKHHHEEIAKLKIEITNA